MVIETNKNIATICGRIRCVEKSHSYIDNNKNVNQFYRMTVEVKRLSETVDFVPVVIHEKLFESFGHFPEEGEFARLSGEIRSRNFTGEDEKRHSEIFFYAQEINGCEDNDYDWTHNCVDFEGYICKAPNAYKTVTGRAVCKFVVAINRRGRSNRASYVPVVCFGNWARFASNLVVGDKVTINARFQSRNYFRKQEIDNIQYTTHELSCVSMESERLGTLEYSEPKVVDLNEYRKSKKIVEARKVG